MLNWWMLAHCFAMSGTTAEAPLSLLIKIRMIVGPAERDVASVMISLQALGNCFNFLTAV